MADLIKKIKIKKQDGTFTDYIPIGADAANVETSDGESVQLKLNKKPYYYTNVASMKADTKLKAGDMAITLGYYEANDGGEAEYQIVNNSELVDDGGSVHSLTNGLKATLIIENNTINFRQLGARPQSKNNVKYDNSSYMTTYLNYLNKVGDKVKLYIPSGIWCFSETTIFRKEGWSIYGDSNFMHHQNSVEGTIITSYNSEQEFVWCIGSENTIQSNFELKGLTFSTGDYSYDGNKFKRVGFNSVSDSAVILQHTEFGFTDKLMFSSIWGRAFRMTSSWEIYFPILNFRSINAFNTSVFTFSPILSSGDNITACSFDHIMFEGVHGDLIEFEPNCGLSNCSWGPINFEDYPVTFFENESVSDINTTFDDSSATHWNIFKFLENTVVSTFDIKSLELNNFSFRKYEINNTKYVYDTIVKAGKNTVIRGSISNILIQGINKDFYYISNVSEENYSNYLTNFKIGKTINTHLSRKGIFNLYAYHNIDAEIVNENISVKNPLIAIIPFYKVRWVHLGDNERGLIYRDDDCINTLGIAICPKYGTETGDMIFGRMYYPGGTLNLRAKIPDGETVRININRQIKTLTGNGSYKWYSFDISSYTNIGDLFNFSSDYANLPSSKIYFDCLCFS